MPRALFVVSDQGQGHKYRCQALADELRSRGWGWTTCGWWESPPKTGYDVIVADGENLDGEGYIAAWEAFQPDAKTVIIADVPGDYPSDLLVAGGAGATPELYKDSGAKKVLAGPAYALLRTQFRGIRYTRPTFLGRAGVFDARSVGGLGSIEMADRMASAEVVITYGGMRALEAACVGAPMVVYARNEGERLNALALNRALAAAWVSEESDCAAMAATLDRTWHLGKMSEAGRALIDGLGVTRVADAIEAL